MDGFPNNSPVLQLNKELQERKLRTEENGTEGNNWKLEEHVKLPRKRKTGRLPAVSKHGKPDSESGLVNRQAPTQRLLTIPSYDSIKWGKAWHRHH